MNSPLPGTLRLTFFGFVLAIICGLALAPPSQGGEPIRIALYDDAGAAGKGVPRVAEILKKTDDFEVTIFQASQVATALQKADLVIFTGGSGSAQGNALGQEGRDEVQRFVRNGGGYLGICAGAYLACSKFSWGLGLLDAQTVSNRWKRGVGNVRIGFTKLGQELTGFPTESCEIKYANGPILKPAGRSDLRPYEPIALFQTELAENGTPAGVMVQSPAMVRGNFGSGRVFISSPHPEQTSGLENTVLAAARWAARNHLP